LCLNANSFANKIDELKVLTTLLTPDIIGITETHLSAQNDSSSLSISGYTLYRSDRRNGIHGGVALYIKSNIISFLITADSDPAGEWESIWCGIKLNSSQTLKIACCYRIPSLAIPTHWPGFLSSLNHSIASSPSAPTLLMGDFNFPTINWSVPHTTQSDSSASHEFIEFLQDHNLSQHVLRPTRHRHGQISSLLDLVITCSDIQVSPISHHAPLGHSDHDVLSFQINLDFCRRLPCADRANFHRADYVLINDILASIDWAYELEGLDVDRQLHILEDFIQNIIIHFVPITNKVNSCRPKWSNNETRLLVNQKKRAYNRFRNLPSPSNLVAFKSARNAAVNGIRQARNHYESNLIIKSKQQPKLLFSYINSNKNTEAASCLKLPDGSILLDDEDISSTFNNFFTSTLKPSALPSPTPFHQPGDVNFTVADVETALHSLSEDTSWGPDKISPVFLKNCATTLAPPFFIIFSSSIQTCTFPSAWKDANVTPVHKKGSKHEVTNYRPISLLSIVSKILERFVHSELLSKCNELNILPASQHGFLPGRSCLTNLLTTYDSITQLVDGGIPCDMLFLDFSKAFDSVSHIKLIEKLTVLCFPQHLVSWIYSYLYARRQRVCLRGHFSSWSHITSGVPQGSVLGPLLFNIYLSDLPKRIRSENCSYADDFKLYSPSYLASSLQLDLDRVVAWSTENALELNPDKCAVMHFGHNNPCTPYHIGTRVITIKTSHPDLGIIVDNKLKFHLHAENSISKAMQKAHFILKCFSKLDTRTFSTLFKTFIRPVLEYCTQVARPCYSSFLSRLESCQRRLTKWCRPIRHLPYQERLCSLNLPTIEKRFLRGDLILVYQIINRLLDLNPSLIFCFASNNSRGHISKLQGSTSHLNIRHRYFTERVVHPWNALPPHTVAAPSLNSFKARLDCFL
jgi:hypothetical protein